MVVVVFRSRLRADANLDELTTLCERMHALVSAMPGFIGIKDFQASDGEAVSIAEFDSLEHVTAWRDHPEHKAAQERCAGHSGQPVIPGTAAGRDPESRSHRLDSRLRGNDEPGEARCFCLCT